MKFIQNNLLILSILAVSLVLRVIVLGSNPVILNRDEAAIGYNAFLLEQVGRDEWGVTWPITLQSFGDYKLIGYPAVVAFLFSISEYSDLMVRLPSALAGVGILYCIYLLAKRFEESVSFKVYSLILAATTPVLFYYSRIAFEANQSLLFFLLFIYFLLRPIDKKTIFFDISAGLSLIFSILTYNTPFLLLPFVLLIFPFVRGVTHYKSWVPFIVFGGGIFIFFSTIFIQLTAHKQGITLFSDPTTHHYYAEYRNHFSGVAQTVIGNRYVYYLKPISINFIQSFSPQFLVFRGGSHPWHQLPGWGHLVLPQYIALVCSILYIARKLIQARDLMSKRNLVTVFKRPLLNYRWGKLTLLMYFLCIGLLPAVITVDAPHATRSLFSLVIMVILGGYLITFLQTRLQKNIYVLGILLNCLLFSGYLFEYFYRYPQLQRDILLSGYDTVLKEVDKEFPASKIAVINPDGYQYILTAWYLKIPPDDFYATIRMQNPDIIGFRYGERVGKYHFIKSELDLAQDEKIVVKWNKDTSHWDVQER